LDFMDYDDVIEINCNVGKNGAKPIPLKNGPDNHIKEMMKTIKCYENHTAEAGINGDTAAAVKAILIHPLIGDYGKGKACFDEMLEAHKIYLPQFFR